ncbi:lipid-binding SYLF domain-containing protein [Sphingomonas bacterium]|uniref:lipid-binding SYLF domain-containing protein n=1 Tax=Sphingomonas bacterium TaxID=1895847 RepID=UPI0015751DC3|nr:lipid-binding SYLF domain-containing protein [Sphingomonas bacterium]
MTFKRSVAFGILGTTALALMLAGTPALAVDQTRHPSADSDAAYGPQKLVDKAASVAVEFQRDRGEAGIMSRARGMYIVPEYGKAGFIIGGKGGAGVVTVRHGGMWTPPAFYNFGGLSIGAQIGAQGGSIIFLLMNAKAVNAFRGGSKFALTANAGLSVVTYSTDGQANLGKADVILLTNTRGAYAGATIEASNVGVDGGRMRDFYGHPVNQNALLDGRVAPTPGSMILTRVLPR